MLHLRYGMIFRQKIKVPLIEIEEIEVLQNNKEKFWGIGSLSISTKKDHPLCVLYAIHDPKDIRNHILKVRDMLLMPKPETTKIRPADFKLENFNPNNKKAMPVTPKIGHHIDTSVSDGIHKSVPTENKMSTEKQVDVKLENIKPDTKKFKYEQIKIDHTKLKIKINIS